MEKKPDRRIRKTRQQIRAGLARLMMTRGIGEITVKELVDEADINRSTFYLHYPDIPGLLREIEQEFIRETRSIAQKYPISAKEKSAYKFIREMFRMLDENRSICRALVGPFGDIGFIRKLEKILEENSQEMLEEMFPQGQDEIQYFYSYCLNGCLGFVRRWLDDGEDMSPEYAAALTYSMVSSSLAAFRGAEKQWVRK